MTTPIASALQAYTSAARAAGPGLAPREEGGSFADVLKGVADTTVGALRQGEQMTARALAGKADINEVVTAVSNAEATLQTVTAVRDRVISAYQDIMRMPI